MNFQYTALSPTSQKLTGTIEASSESEAREKLNRLSLSIIELSIMADGKPLPKAGAGIRFVFEATDRNGKKVIGTIDAKDTAEAFMKLSEDYHLTIMALSPEATPEQKIDLKPLQESYEKKRTKEEDAEKILAREKETERKELLHKVDTTMETVQAFLNEYGPDMKPEERERIRAYINQLFRIKDSTNLTHIKRTCETMLAYLRDREVFLKEARKLKEQAVIKVESRHLLEELKHMGIKREIDMATVLTWFSKIPGLGGFFSTIEHRFAFDDPQAMELRKKLKDIKSRIWEFRKIAFKSKDHAYRAEIAQAIEALKGEKKRLSFELRGILAKRKEALLLEKAARGVTSSSMELFIGWLLAFYLTFYFVTFPFASKDLGIREIPLTFSFYEVNFLKTVLPLLFLLHIAITLRRELFPGKILPSFLTYTFFGIAYLFFLFNFII